MMKHYSPFWNRMYTESDEWNDTAEKILHNTQYFK